MALVNVSSSPTATDDWIRDAALAQATRAARLGDYAAAEAILRSAPWFSDWADGLDLLARVRAQQGDLNSAIELWRQAARLPGGPHDQMSAAAAEAERWKGRLSGRDRLWLFTIALALAVFLLAVMLAYRPSAPARTASLDTDTQPLTTSAEPTPSSNLESTPQLGPINATLQSSLSIPGVAVKQNVDGLELTFDRGLFRRATELTPYGAEILRDLSVRLAPGASRLHLLVVGYTDQRTVLPSSPFADNVELGLARGAFVANVIRQEAGFSPERISVMSLGYASAPYPDDKNGGRDNRTVVIHVRTHP